MQARLYACFAEACDDLRHAAQAALLRACLLSARHMGLEAQMRGLCKKGEHMNHCKTCNASNNNTVERVIRCGTCKVQLIGMPTKYKAAHGIKENT